MSSSSAFAVRSLEPEQVVVPYVDECRAKKIGRFDDVGMQARIAPVLCNPKVIVIMGGLSMPNVPVKAEQVKSVIDNHSGVAVIGVCFMHIFEKAGWLSTVSFDCIIDAMIDPVEVTTKSFFLKESADRIDTALHKFNRFNVLRPNNHRYGYPFLYTLHGRCHAPHKPVLPELPDGEDRV